MTSVHPHCRAGSVKSVNKTTWSIMGTILSVSVNVQVYNAVDLLNARTCLLTWEFIGAWDQLWLDGIPATWTRWMHLNQ